MQYKNIEIHGAAELIECEDGGVRWLRVPRSVYDAMENDHGKKMCYNNTGIELRFVVKGDKVITYSRLPKNASLEAYAKPER